MSNLTSRPTIVKRDHDLNGAVPRGKSQFIDLEKERRLTIMKLVRRRAAEAFKDAREELKERAECLSKTKSGRIVQSMFSLASQGVSILFSPVALYGDLKGLRKAWHTYKNDPKSRDKARAETLLNIVTSSMNVGKIFAPAICGVCGTLADGAKLASEVDKIGKIVENKPPKDRLQETAKLIANSPGLRKALDLFMFAGGETEILLTNSLKSLKEAFTPDADIRERREALKGLKQFYKTYSRYYPKVEQERFSSMVSYLKDKNDKWNAHLIEENKNVVGGFTCYHLEHKEHGKTLFIEQIIPPFSQDPKGYIQAWEHIIELAKDNGMQRIWVEARKDEPLPSEFSEADLYHMQHELKGRSGQSNELRMCVMNINNKAQVTHREYHDVVVDCILSWAELSDPAARVFRNHIPNNRRPIPFREKRETDLMYENYLKTMKV